MGRNRIVVGDDGIIEIPRDVKGGARTIESPGPSGIGADDLQAARAAVERFRDTGRLSASGAKASMAVLETLLDKPLDGADDLVRVALMLDEARRHLLDAAVRLGSEVARETVKNEDRAEELLQDDLA